MGLFRINMPTLYGEGRNAFYRLQEEIMKASTDTSLFAWGNVSIDDCSFILLDRDILRDDSAMTYLLAPSPAYFSLCDDVVDDGPMIAAEVCLSLN